MAKGKFYESDYEEAFVDLLQQNGWEYTFGDDLHRQYDQTIIEDDMRAYLQKRYADAHLTSAEVETIIANLRNIGEPSLYHTLRSTFTLYRDGFLFQRHNSNETLWIDYLDFKSDDPKEHNIFRCVNQYIVSYEAGQKTRRPDVILFINGIPVLVVELKNPADENATIADAYDQIHIRYKRDIPHLMKYCALSCISDASNSRLGTTYTPYIHYYAWKKVENEDDTAKMGIPELMTLINGAYRPDRILQLLRDFTYFPDLKAGKEEEIVCRYPQFFATHKLFDNILKHLRSNGGDGKGGTYFGATGCGKTYTMVFLARQLALRSKELGSPTIVILVDREDLQKQSVKLFENSTDFLSNGMVRKIEDRDDLKTELSQRESGGVFICTIQKFCGETGLLSERTNIICFSDEAHRTQTSVGSKLKIVDKLPEKKDGRTSTALAEDNPEEQLGAFVTYGFAKYLRDAFPNATYVGFTGTPIDETVHVFGEVVDKYTMNEAVRDGITVGIKYIPRLARVVLDAAKAAAIEKYYEQCYDEGAKPEDIKKSKEAMASLEVIIGDPERLRRIAVDVVDHFEKTCAEQPELLQKAMIVCSNRQIAYNLYCKFKDIRPEWFEKKKCEDESKLSKEELEKLKEVPYINIVATRGANDPEDMYNALGEDSHRDMLAEQFKNENSNFRIAVVVDMWVTGFDVPCLSVLYNDKPLQRHNLIQTISRVNRKFQVVVPDPEGDRIVEKPNGLIVDYIGIHEKMEQALKQYGGDGAATSKDDLEASKIIFDNELQILKELMCRCNLNDYFSDVPLKRLLSLQAGAEFVLSQIRVEGQKVTFQTLFKQHVKRMRSAYNICNPAGVLSDEDVSWAQCFMAILSYVNKAIPGQHDVASMNKAVEAMVREAIMCTGVESLLQTDPEIEIFEENFVKHLAEIKMPNTKFQLLVKMLSKAIREYSKTNKVAAKKFEDMLKELVQQYNDRDKDVFGNKVAGEAIEQIQQKVEKKVQSLTEKILELFKSLKKDKEKFKELGITFEEKAFFDILVAVRDENKFEYADEKCVDLSKKIKELIDNTAIYADWNNNDNLKAELADNMIDLLYDNGYPPAWNDEVYDRVMDQVNNFKKYN
ncbi:MAG: type I restriction endonuclease subunit R [Bacteroidaceae bacterium]|nr:type I restriction endonuclease subunit R [Bacteroidaceae bacterium]